MNISKKMLLAVILTTVIAFLSGCATTKSKSESKDPVQKELYSLKKQINILEKEKDEQKAQIAALKEQLAEALKEEQEKTTDLERAKKEFEKKLHKELSEYKAKLEMTEKGLVVTFLAEIFFDSGKAEVKESAKPTLKKVADILQKKVPGCKVAIEGHTDDEPITYSGWDSNWELASARALSVLHYFIDDASIDPRLLSADSFGQYSPVASNDTEEGRQQNRRVEIVIIPRSLTKVR